MNLGNRNNIATVWTLVLAALIVIGLAVTASFPALAAASGTWSLTGSMNTGREDHTATLLQNGEVLVAGGISAADATLASAELYSPTRGKCTVTGNMTTARYGHSAELLPNGEVLVAGGISSTSNGTILGESELYNPTTGAWTKTGSLTTARYEHGAAMLTDGQVLVAGGYGAEDSILASAEAYNPTTGKRVVTGGLHDARSTNAALLRVGAVLMAGGVGSGNENTAETYLNGVWTLTTAMVFSHPSRRIAALADGDALIYGGTLASYVAEYYAPSTGSWTATHDLGLNPPGGNTLTLLNSGEVLLVGGSTHVGTSYVAQTSCHLYTSSNNAWSSTGSLNHARVAHTATLLQNGEVLAAGGGATPASAELYTP
jgi:hypothetical protein